MSSKRRLSTSFNSSLRVKVTLSVVLPLILILGSFTAIQYKRQQDSTLANLAILAAQTTQVIKNSLWYQMRSRNLAGLQNTLDAIGSGETIRPVYLLDTSGRVVFAPDGDGVGLVLNNRDPTCQPCHRMPVAQRPRSVVVTLPEGQRVFRTMNPIENRSECHECHGDTNHLLGLLLTDISMAPLEGSLAAELRENLMWWVATVLVTVVVVNLAISRFVVRRLEGLAAAIADLHRGRLPAPLPESQPDEIGQLVGGFNAMARQVEARDMENRALTERLRQQSAQRGKLLKRLITAQEDERKRVARELHDTLGQPLAGLALRAEAMERLITSDPERALLHLEQIRALGSLTADRMYDLILDLRPSALDDLGLLAALRAYAERLTTQTDMTFEIDGSGVSTRLPPELETALYRILQEALNNVVRHAEARRVQVRLMRYDGILEGQVMDDGRGFDLSSLGMDGQNPRGLGLLGMRERVTQCGGELEIDSEPGRGTRLYIRIPVEGTPYG